jgi:hypothetical protein
VWCGRQVPIGGGGTSGSGARLRWARRGLADSGALSTLDQVDAALAAATGLHALAGRHAAVGTADEGLIVVPADELPVRSLQQGG